MRKIFILSAAMFCAVFSFAQKGMGKNMNLLQNAVVSDSVKIQDKMDNYDALTKKYLIYMLNHDTGNTVKEPDIPAAVKIKIDKAFADFTGINDEHKKEFYKIFKEYLVKEYLKHSDGADILKSVVTFKDGQEFSKQFEGYAVNTHETGNDMSRIQLALDVSRGSMTSVSVIPPQNMFQIGEYELYLYKWNVVRTLDPKKGFWESSIAAENISPKDMNTVLKKQLKAAGFQFSSRAAAHALE